MLKYIVILIALFGTACKKPDIVVQSVKVSESQLMVSEEIPLPVAAPSPVPAMSEPPKWKLIKTVDPITVIVEAPKKITFTVPKKETVDTFTKVNYTQIGVFVMYQKNMKVGKDYPVVVKAFRGTYTEAPANKESVTVFVTMASKNVGILLEGDAFRITPNFTNLTQTLLPEDEANRWDFTVLPLKVGTQLLQVKLGTSDSGDFLAYKDPDTKQVTVETSIGILRVKSILIKEHYIRNQLIYNSLSGIIVFLSGFVAIKKRKRK